MKHIRPGCKKSRPHKPEYNFKKTGVAGGYLGGGIYKVEGGVDVCGIALVKPHHDKIEKLEVVETTQGVVAYKQKFGEFLGLFPEEILIPDLKII